MSKRKNPHKIAALALAVLLLAGGIPAMAMGAGTDSIEVEAMATQETGEPAAGPQDEGGAALLGDTALPFGLADDLRWGSYSTDSKYDIQQTSDTELQVPISTDLSLMGEYFIQYGSGEIGAIELQYPPGWTQPTKTTNPANPEIIVGEPTIKGSTAAGYTVRYETSSTAANGALSFGANIRPKNANVYPGAKLAVTVVVYDRDNAAISGMGGSLGVTIHTDMYEPRWATAGFNRANDVLHNNKADYPDAEACNSRVGLSFTGRLSDSLLAYYGFGGDVDYSEEAQLKIDMRKIQYGTTGSYSDDLPQIPEVWLQDLDFGGSGNEYDPVTYTLTIKGSLLGSIVGYASANVSIQDSSIIPAGTYLWFHDSSMYWIEDSSGVVTNTLYINNAVGAEGAKVPFDASAFVPISGIGSLYIDAYVPGAGQITVAPYSPIGNRHPKGDTLWLAGQPSLVQSLGSLYIKSQNHVVNGTLAFEMEIPAGIAITHVSIPEVPENSNGAKYGGTVTFSDAQGLVGTAVLGQQQGLALDRPVTNRLVISLDYLGSNAGNTYFNDITLDSYSSSKPGVARTNETIGFYGTVSESWKDGDSAVWEIPSTSITAKNGGTLPNDRVGSQFPYSIGGIAPYETNVLTESDMYGVDTATGLPSARLATNAPQSIGDAFFICLSVNDWRETYSVDTYTPFNYSTADAILEDPVIYISLPEYLTSIRGDQEFTKEDVVSFLPEGADGSVLSVRTVKDAAGNLLPGVNGGCVVEICFSSVHPLSYVYETGSQTYPDLRSTTGDFNSKPFHMATTEYAFLRVVAKQDVGLFPTTQTPSDFSSGSILASTMSRSRKPVSSILYDDAKALLAGDMGFDSEEITTAYGVAPFNVSDKGGYAMDNGILNDIVFTWPQSGSMRVYVETEDGARTTYNPVSSDGAHAEISAGAGGEYIIEITNQSTVDTKDIVCYFEIPSNERWRTHVAGSLVTDPASTAAGIPTVQYAEVGATPDMYSTTGWTAPYSSTTTAGAPYAIKIQIPQLAAGQKYVGRLAFTLPAVDGVTVLVGDTVVGATKFDFGQINSADIKSVNGDAYTAAVIIPAGGPIIPPSNTTPVLTAPDAYIEAGSQSFGWLTSVTATDGEGGDLTDAVKINEITALRPATRTAIDPATPLDANQPNRYTVTYSVSNSAGVTVSASRTITLYKDIQVLFDAQGGANVTAQTVRFPESYGALPNTTRAEYTFLGWYTAPVGGSIITATTPVREINDHILYARWEPVQVVTPVDPPVDVDPPVVNPGTPAATGGADTVQTGDNGFTGWALLAFAALLVLAALALVRRKKQSEE